ncbi:SMI1/KNR4 family protein [Nocardioides sp.]|uniref:SMI1/KNR4 family protein n=1 Tax=Nocardioides sp. TaxID=35761 RepID=UPI002D7F4791|nr:SMI1/KNR4 family protein [Nocardioides sp.]
MSALVDRLETLEGLVLLPGRTLRRIQAGETNALMAANFLVLGPAEPSRASWAPWFSVAVLRRVPWGSAPPHELAEAWFRPHSAVSGDFDGMFGDEDVPTSLAIPSGMSLDERVRWWSKAVLIQAWVRHDTATPQALRPASQVEAVACEERIGVLIPQSLRTYHLALGASETLEEILPLTPRGYEAFGPLLDAFPGIPDLLETLPDRIAILEQVDSLVAFGSYLGNGNYWCFHRDDGSVWYFDHDGGQAAGWRGGDGTAVLTRMFDDVGEYFDALTVIAIGQAHEALGGQDFSEVELRAMLGDQRVSTWLY